MKYYLAQRQAAWGLGVEDGRVENLRPVDKICEAVGYDPQGKTSDDYPHDLARCYLHGFETGQELANR